MDNPAGRNRGRQHAGAYRESRYPPDDCSSCAEEVPLLSLWDQGCAHGGGKSEPALQALLSQDYYV